MNLFDYFIIYLTCGAPFAVYYYLQNRAAKKNARWLYLKTALNFFFWIFSAVFLLWRNRLFSFNTITAEDSIQETNIRLMEKRLEELFLQSRLSISVYEFREILERYIGLTLTQQSEETQITEAEKEIFRIAAKKNIETGAICLHRRNRKRLVRHQIEARSDFLILVNQMSESDSDRAAVKSRSIELAELLQDTETIAELEMLMPVEPQTDYRLSVKYTEKDLWKSGIPKPSPVKQISYQSSVMKTRMSLREKD